MKTVLITGCSSGFGRDLVDRFLVENYRVIATMRRLSEREELFFNLKEKYQEKLILAELDITKADQRQSVIADLDQLDILVNNAGFGLYGALEDMDEEQVRHQMEVNFLGTTLMIKDCLHLLRQSKGKIINISSMLGRSGMPLSAVYSASKFSVEGLVEGLVYELGPIGVQVCNVCPGRHRTHFMKNLAWAKNSQSQSSVYLTQVGNLEAMLKKFSQGKGIPLSNVTKKIVSLAKKKRMPIRVYVGRDAVSYNILRSLFPDNFFLLFLKRAYSALIRKKNRV